MIKVAGWIVALYASAHTVLALTVEGAASHAGAWFSGDLWGEDLAHMSPASSALWLSLSSFGPTLCLIGLTVLWMDRRGITPPAFLAWALLLLTVVDGVINLLTPWPVLLVADVLLLLGIRRAQLGGEFVPYPDEGGRFSGS